MRFSKERPRKTCGASEWLGHLNINAIMMIIAGIPKIAARRKEFRHLNETNDSIRMKGDQSFTFEFLDNELLINSLNWNLR